LPVATTRNKSQHIVVFLYNTPSNYSQLVYPGEQYSGALHRIKSFALFVCGAEVKEWPKKSFATAGASLLRQW
jgi:hypothetical protein